MPRLAWQCILACAVLTCAQAGRAAAAGAFAVNPVSVTIAAGSQSADVIVTNQSNQTQRFSATGYHWSQTASNALVLAPSDDLLVFPAIFSLAAGQSRRLRIGTLLAPAAVERTFRVYLEQLPPPQTAKPAGLTLRIRLRIGIPVFVEPDSEARPSLVLESVRSARGELTVTVANRGNSHADVRIVDVTARSKDGMAIAAMHARGWYVLAGAPQEYHVKIARSTCERAASYDVTVRTTGGELDKSVSATGGC